MGLKTTGRAELPIELRLSWGSNDEGERHANVTVEDRISNMVLLEYRLTGPQLAKFLSGSGCYVNAQLVAHLDRVGKRMQHGSALFPSATYDHLAAAQVAAEAWRVTYAWDVVSVSRNNVANWVFIGRRWVDPLKKEEK